jgi:hypothetical protein
VGEQWYYANGDQQQGPYSLEQVNEFAKAGEFSPWDLVWTDTMEDWKPASEVEEIEFPPATSKPPPILPTQKVTSAQSSFVQLRMTSLPRIPAILWSILMFAGAGLLFLAFVVPWWGIDVKSGNDASRKQRETANEVKARNTFWYLQHIRPLSKMDDPDEDGMTLWGWSTGTGITGFLFAFLILPIAIVPLCIKALHPWSWIGRFLVTIPGCVMLIMFFIWFFGAPSKNVSPILYQGLYLGPYLVFLAGGLLLLTGVLGGSLGLIDFLTWLKFSSTDAEAADVKVSTDTSVAELEIE